MYRKPKTQEQRDKYNATRRAYRKAQGNADTHKYEKTPKGFLMRLYRNMKSRTKGIQVLKAHLYEGKELLSKEDFYKWADSHEFRQMFKFWEENNYDRKLCPTVDRIDTNKGYEISNMRWLTHSENSSLGAIRRNELYDFSGNKK